MVTIHRAFGFRFVIYTNDHDPAHVHVVGPSGEAKIQIVGPAAPEAIWSMGLAPAEMRKVMAEVKLKRLLFLTRWHEIHG